MTFLETQMTYAFVWKQARLGYKLEICRDISARDLVECRIVKSKSEARAIADMFGAKARNF